MATQADETQTQKDDTSAETKKTETSTEGNENESGKSEETKEQMIPISRLNEMIEKRKASDARLAEIEAEQAKAAEEAERARIAKLPEEEALKERATLTQQYEAENKSLKAEVKTLTDSLKVHLDSELKGLSKKDQQAIQAMASDVPGQLAALARAKEAGWIGGQTKPPVPQTHKGKAGANLNGSTPDLSTPDGAFALLSKRMAGG